MNGNRRRLRLLMSLSLGAALTSLLSGCSHTDTSQRGVAPVSSQQSPSHQPGPYYALVIGINDYRDVQKLATPVNDAEAVAKTLQNDFGFQVKVLPNATRHQILSALDEYTSSLSEDASLIVYYGGHGYFDKDTQKGYWLPVDAERDNRADWISADDITNEIHAIPARHVLIVSDSCYSGTLTRDANIPRDRHPEIDKLLARKSRFVMSSGGDEPVADGGPSHHSVFANAFLQGLSQMDEDTFTGNGLFDRVRRQVGGGSDQLPEYNSIRNSGDEGGDFVFFRHGSSARSSLEKPDVAPSVPSSAGSESASKGLTLPPRRGGASKPNSPHPQAAATAPSGDLGVERFLSMGNQYWRNGDYDKAIAEYQQGLRVDPTNKELKDGLQKATRAKDDEAKILQQ